MPSKAYVLIKTSVKSMAKVYLQVKEMNVVSQVDAVTGPYDLIAIVEGESQDAILDVIHRQIRYVSGVVETVTCFTFEPRAK